jgi:uncharacterized protein (TIGR00255 family)
MTGFGEGHRQADAVAVAVEVRTINNRYFKLTVRSTETYASLESQIEAVVRKRIKRGTVTVHVRVDRAVSPDDIRLNREVIDIYRQQLEAMSADWSLRESVPLAALLTLPGVVEDHSADPEHLAKDWPQIAAALGDALDGLEKMRTEEGAALADDLSANCAGITQELAEIEALLPLVVEQYRDRLTQRVNKTLEKHNVSLEPGDVIREVSLLGERSDVSEELVRLRSHVEQFELLIHSAESAGRKLDFITQEMFREANTIGSKANDTEIPKHVVQIKVMIERMREQVQNVE